MIKAIVTLYCPQKEDKNHILRIMQQADWLYICDNSPYSSEEEYVGYDKVTYFHWGENRGLSYAFNTVLKDTALGWHENDYVMFFDQDTVIPKGHIVKLMEEYSRLRELGVNTGCIGPCYFNTSNNTLELPRRKVLLSEKTLAVKSIITTSMLCRYKDLHSIGFWNEDVFLDMADWDLCWRFLKHGYQCCMTKASVIRHAVGTGEKRIGFFSMRVGRPVREYYQLRDCRYLFWKHYVPVWFKVRFVMMLTVRSAAHILFLDERKQRIFYMKKARRDYMKGVKGAAGNRPALVNR